MTILDTINPAVWKTLLTVFVLLLPSLITGLTKYPRIETGLKLLLLLCERLSVVAHKDIPNATFKLPLTKSPRPLMPASQRPSIATGGAIIGLLLLVLAATGPARADVVISHGPSIPMLEFTGATHPVQFAPGFGYQLSLGLFQFALLNQQWDALNFSAIGFGNVVDAPNGDPSGSCQAALAIGTFNNIVAIGAAVPLFGASSGVFQGQFHVYPMLSINIPLSFTPLTPPVGYTPGPRGLPRGGTIYLGGGNQQ